MKIGLVCPYNIAKGGGVQEIVRDLHAGLTARGHDVKIITPQPREHKLLSDPDVIFIGNGGDFRSPLHTTAQFSASVEVDEIDRVLNAERFDVLHFHEPWVPVLSRQILSRSRAVNIATFHAKLPETMMSRTVAKVVTPYTKSALKYLHALTAVSDAAAEYVGSLTDEPITIIPNGINLKHYMPAKPIKKAKTNDPIKTILYIGRIEQRKGLKYLLKAYELLVKDQDDVQLIIVGDGPDREKMEMLASTLMLPNVSFLGYVSDEVKLKLLQSADLFCSPAVYGESFGLVLLEAMACDLVIVAGDNSGYSSVMRDMGNLSLVNPKETDEFARRLSLLLNEPTLRADWKKWAKKYVKQFNYPAIIDQYEALYEHTIKHHSHHIRPYDDDEEE
jgi:phosphatidylinositol alpha-mannosyltransferase